MTSRSISGMVAHRRATRRGVLGAGGTGAAAAVDNVKTGGVYQFVLQNDPPSTDPFKHASYVSQLAAGYPYSKLLKHKTGGNVRPNDFEVTEDLAESWQITDPTTYTFKLRSGVRFHNIPPVS